MTREKTGRAMYTMNRTVMLLSNFYITFSTNMVEHRDQHYFDRVFSNYEQLLKTHPDTKIELFYGPGCLTEFSRALRSFLRSLKVGSDHMLEICRVNQIFVDPAELRV